MARMALIIPTRNGNETFKQLLEAVAVQSIQPNRKIVIDSSSTDQTVDYAHAYGYEVISILPEHFNHGATRQMGVQMVQDVDYVVFLTQDAILADRDSLNNLLSMFDDSTVAAVYGRQLPRRDARPIEAYARLFNYPAKNAVKSMADAPKLGIKTAFISNSFAAYRLHCLMAVHGFSKDVILGEDTCLAAKLLLEGWKIAYCANARVIHSHHYTMAQEFKRYFDIGVLHAREQWMMQKLGRAESEGLRFICSEWQYLWQNGFCLYILPALVRNMIKYIGYRLGKAERFLPVAIKPYISMHKKFWDTREGKR